VNGLWAGAAESKMIRDQIPRGRPGLRWEEVEPLVERRTGLWAEESSFDIRRRTPRGRQAVPKCPTRYAAAGMVVGQWRLRLGAEMWWV